MVRRALEVEELRKLISKTATGPERCGLSGGQRAVLYKLAAETGLRRAEIMSLRRSSFDLAANPPTVKLQAAYSKRRREDVIPLRQDLARELEKMLQRCTPAALAFPVPSNWNSAVMIREDAVDAEILKPDDAPKKDAANPAEVVEGSNPEDETDVPTLDFHCLRHSFVTNLVHAGVQPKVAQALARHSTITLTMDRYTHLRIDDELRALDALPNLSIPPATDAKLKNGTDDLPER